MENAEKVKNNINRNLSLLIGGIIPRTFLKFETVKCYYLHSEHPKNKKIIFDFVKQEQRIKPKTYFPFIYLFV